MSSNELEEYRRIYGEPPLPDEPAAPILGYNGGRAMLRGHLRSAISPWIDIRTKLDIVSRKQHPRSRSRYDAQA
jgi:hypothetical protein